MGYLESISISKAEFEAETKRLEQMLESLARYMTLIGLKEVEAGIYSHDLLAHWFELLNERNTDDVNGVPLSLKMMPLDKTDVQLVAEVFSDLNQQYRDAIIYAWNEFRGDLLINSIQSFLNEDEPAEFTISFGRLLHLVPDADLDTQTSVAFRMFSNYEVAKLYDVDESEDSQ